VDEPTGTGLSSRPPSQHPKHRHKAPKLAKLLGRPHKPVGITIGDLVPKKAELTYEGYGLLGELKKFIVSSIQNCNILAFELLSYSYS
jgi:hypothetical protein